MIKVIPFPFCNLGSVKRFLDKSDFTFEIAASSFNSHDIIIIPGVGQFQEGVAYLHNSSLYSDIRNHALSGGALLGICLGMQLLFESSDESPGVTGLSLLKGNCTRIARHNNFSVPHIGWNSLKIPTHMRSVYTHFLDESTSNTLADFYFAHSYVVNPVDASCVSSTFSHPSGNLCASIKSNRIFGFQFHPEKSGKDGYKLLQSTLKSLLS